MTEKTDEENSSRSGAFVRRHAIDRGKRHADGVGHEAGVGCRAGRLGLRARLPRDAMGSMQAKPLGTSAGTGILGSSPAGLGWSAPWLVRRSPGMASLPRQRSLSRQVPLLIFPQLEAALNALRVTAHV